MSKGLILDEHIVGLDESVKIELKIARLPSGTWIKMPVYVYRSKNPGPSVLLSGGLHGDETNGVEIVRRLLKSRHLDDLLSGTVVAVPIMNVFGFLNFSRAVPDGKDVNRSFPGRQSGSLASLTAWTISNKILPSVDYILDFHTGGASRVNYPQVRYTPGDEKSLELAKLFSAPLMLPSATIAKSLRWYAGSIGKSVLVYEGGESMRNDEFVIDEGVSGSLRVLEGLGMVGPISTHGEKVISLTGSKWIRAAKSGMFRPFKSAGDHIGVGDILGVINDPFNAYESVIKSSSEGVLIGNNNISLVHKGDALFHVGLI
jgi:predicted deacylase